MMVCTGWSSTPGHLLGGLGYGKLPNMIASSSSSRCSSRVAVELKNGRLPQYVSIIHCVGSRSEQLPRLLLARVLQTARSTRTRVESTALPRSYVSDVYVDMHAFGKECEDFYRRSARS